MIKTTHLMALFGGVAVAAMVGCGGGASGSGSLPSTGSMSTARASMSAATGGPVTGSASGAATAPSLSDIVPGAHPATAPTSHTISSATFPPLPAPLPSPLLAAPFEIVFTEADTVTINGLKQWIYQTPQQCLTADGKSFSLELYDTTAPAKGWVTVQQSDKVTRSTVHFALTTQSFTLAAGHTYVLTIAYTPGGAPSTCPTPPAPTPAPLPTGSGTPTFTVYNVTDPESLVQGPDGAIWFTQGGIGEIGRLDPTTGTVTEYPVPFTPSGPTLENLQQAAPAHIVNGPDGNMWFFENATAKIARITTSGQITEFAISQYPASGVEFEGLAAGPDGNLWATRDPTWAYSGAPSPQVLKVSTGGALLASYAPTNSLATSQCLDPSIEAIATSPDGNLAFSWCDGLGEMTTSGTVSGFYSLNIPFYYEGYPTTAFGSIGTGYDKNLWMTGETGNDEGVWKFGLGTKQFNLAYTASQSQCVPQYVTPGPAPDGRMYFTCWNYQSSNSPYVGSITASGQAYLYQTPAGVWPYLSYITVASDGSIWLSDEGGANKIIRMRMAY